MTVIYGSQEVHVPAWVVDLESFRRWADSDDFPDFGQVSFLQGEVWLDMSKEQLFSHVDVKDEYTMVLRRLTKAADLGRYFSDGLFLTNVPADIAGKPDGTFVFYESIRCGKARLIEAKDELGYVELEGTPDMVLEVVSKGSIRKDTILLRQAYWEAGIAEYWLVDARGQDVRFDILKHTAKGYSAVRKQSGWIKSAVFGKAFQLRCELDQGGNPKYTLAVR